MMTQYNPTTVSAAYGVYSMSVKHFLDIIYVPQLLLSLSAIYYTQTYDFITEISLS